MSVQTEAPRGRWMSDALRRYLKIAYIAACSLLIVGVAVLPIGRDTFRLFVETMVAGSPWWRMIIPFGVLCLVLCIWLNNKLESRQSKWLEWSAWGSKTNAAMEPLTRRKLIWLSYLPFLFVAVPTLALAEEYLLRYLFRGWLAVFLMSGVVFGIIHIVMGVSVRMTIVNGVLGMVLGSIFNISLGYMDEMIALWLVTVIHAAYNYWAITFIIFSLKLREPLAAFLATSSNVAASFARRQLPTVVGWVAKSPGTVTG